MMSLSPEVVQLIWGIAVLVAICFAIWVFFGRD
jgi:hypothetical protein